MYILSWKKSPGFNGRSCSMVFNSMGSDARLSRFMVRFYLFTSYVSLNKLLTFFIIHLPNGDHNNIHLPELSWGLKWVGLYKVCARLVAQSHPTLCDPMDCSRHSPLSMGFPRQEYWEWVAISSSRGSSQPRDWTWVCCISCIAGGFFTTEPSGTEKAMASHSSTLAWKIPWTEEPGRLQTMVAKSQKRLEDFTFTFHFHALEKEMATHSGVLAWRIPGTAEPGGRPSMGSHRVGHDWSDLAAAATEPSGKLST